MLFVKKVRMSNYFCCNKTKDKTLSLIIIHHRFYVNEYLEYLHLFNKYVKNQKKSIKKSINHTIDNCVVVIYYLIRI